MRRTAATVETFSEKREVPIFVNICDANKPESVNRELAKFGNVTAAKAHNRLALLIGNI